MERSEVKRTDRASGRGNSPKGLGKRADPGHTAKGQVKSGQTPSRWWGVELKSCSLPARGAIADTGAGQGVDGGGADTVCALGTLRRGDPPAQGGEEQAEEDVAVNMLSTVTVVILTESIFILSGHLDY